MEEINVLEVYLFINPLGSRCMKSEQCILKLADEIFDHISYQFIPLLTPQMIDQQLKCDQEDGHNLSLRNRVFQLHYQAILDYKAALFQGKKRGRQFLMALQDALINDDERYCDDLVMSLADDTHLDVDMFGEDRRSDIAKRAFQADQRLASEMKVDAPSTAILYNADVSDYGLMLNDVTDQTLFEVCENQGLLANQALAKQKQEDHPTFHIL
ncbi:DsbA family protein [Secundilactobacillus collinoides]|nr:DsbA family protein [Secundilactobacillus collinoides]